MGKSESIKNQVIRLGSSIQIGGRVRNRTDIHLEVSTGNSKLIPKKSPCAHGRRGKKGEKRREARKSSYLGVGAQRGL